MHLLQENNINGGYVEESFSENLGARKKIKIFLSPTSLKT